MDRQRAACRDIPWLACGAARAMDVPADAGERQRTRRSPFGYRPRPLDGLKEDRKSVTDALLRWAQPFPRTGCVLLREGILRTMGRAGQSAVGWLAVGADRWNPASVGGHTHGTLGSWELRRASSSAICPWASTIARASSPTPRREFSSERSPMSRLRTSRCAV